MKKRIVAILSMVKYADSCYQSGHGGKNEGS